MYGTRSWHTYRYTWFVLETGCDRSGIRAVSTVGRKPRLKWLLPKVYFTLKIIHALSLTYLVKSYHTCPFSFGKSSLISYFSSLMSFICTFLLCK
jgi:hypothetical protein